MVNVHMMTVANKNYWHYVLPYIASTLNSYPNYSAEIFLDNKEVFVSCHKEILEVMREMYGDSWALRQLPNTCIRPKAGMKLNWGSFRWMIKPQTKKELTYIGDVDIMILPEEQELGEFHFGVMEWTKLPYSNIVRQLTSKNKLLKITGLHCVKTEEYFSKVDMKWIENELNRHNGHICDEVLLYNAMVKFFGIPTKNKKRPIHGIHMSHGRCVIPPIGIKKCHWGITPLWIDKYEEMKKSENWKTLITKFDPQYLVMISQLEGGIQEYKRRKNI